MLVHYKYFCEAQIIETFDKLLHNERSEIVSLVLSFLANMMGENIVDFNFDIINSKIFKTISTLVNKGENALEVSQNLAYFISNLITQNNPSLEESIVKYMS
jgi:DNA polymerase III gamma/tau subunit